MTDRQKEVLLFILNWADTKPIPNRLVRGILNLNKKGEGPRALWITTIIGTILWFAFYVQRTFMCVCSFKKLIQVEKQSWDMYFRPVLLISSCGSTMIYEVNLVLYRKHWPITGGFFNNFQITGRFFNNFQITGGFFNNFQITGRFFKQFPNHR